MYTSISISMGVYMYQLPADLLQDGCFLSVALHHGLTFQ